MKGAADLGRDERQADLAFLDRVVSSAELATPDASDGPSPEVILQGGAPTLAAAGAQRRVISRRVSAEVWSEPQARAVNKRGRQPGMPATAPSHITSLSPGNLSSQ
eukprot:scaffold122522_cov33-Prasinocladus_malaysianus.AAC.1